MKAKVKTLDPEQLRADIRWLFRQSRPLRQIRTRPAWPHRPPEAPAPVRRVAVAA
jgi:hypothetical protein